MAYEVSAAAEQSERLVVAVGGVSLVYGEALDSDRESAENGEGVVIVAEQENGIYVTDSADVASDLAILAERIPEVAEVVQVEHKPDLVEPEAAELIVTQVEPADPADSVVPAGETTPGLDREVVELEPGEPAVEVIDEDDEQSKTPPEGGR